MFDLKARNMLFKNINSLHTYPTLIFLRETASFLSQAAACDGQTNTVNSDSPCTSTQDNTLPLFQN